MSWSGAGANLAQGYLHYMQAASMGDHPITLRLGLESNIITPTLSSYTILFYHTANPNPAMYC